MRDQIVRSGRAGGAELRGFGWRPLGRRAPVIADLDLRVEPGERLLLTGPSGAGKSTVLRAFAGALGTTISGDLAGEVTVHDQIGLLLQNPGDAIVAERIGRDVAFGPENMQVPREEIWGRVREAAAAVGLPYGLDRPTAALSGGELQRLSLAGVLAMRPGILLLDEPTSMLDAENARTVRRAILSAAVDTGASMVVVEHRIEPWLEHVDRVVVLSREGSIVGDGPPAEFKSRHGAELAANGVWMPGVPPPSLPDLPPELVEPTMPRLTLEACGLEVDLRTRTLDGPVVSHALRGVDIRLEPAAVTAFTGPSGAGKSTTVAAFAGLVQPTGGEIRGVDRPLHRWRSADLARQIGWVPQNPEHGFLTTRVADEVALTGRRLGVAVDAGAVLDLFGLAHLARANPYQLSGGEQRRLALAAALAHRPGVLLLDEPTVGQDRDTWATTAGWVAAAARAGAAVGVATHDADLVALADRDVEMRAGRLA